MNSDSIQPAEALFERGRMLLMHNRPAEAERFLRECLSHDPENAHALHLLAICLQAGGSRSGEALQAIDRAIALEPEWGPLHARRSLILSDLHRLKEARTSAEAAITLDPDDSEAHAARAYSFLRESRWPEAEAGARAALALDADDRLAQNVLSQSLVFQGKAEESRVDVSARLARNPEDAFTHFNAGYAALRAGNPREAETHFLESLRLDANFDAAREGLLESFRARNAVYRGYLRFAFAMAEFSDRTRTFLVIGAYVLMRLVTEALAGVSPALAIGLGVLYSLFVVWTYVARGVGNLFVLADARARVALNGREKLEGFAVGGGVLVGLLLLTGGLVSGSILATIAGGCLMAQAIPVALFLTSENARARLIFGVLGAVVVVAVGGILAALILPGWFSGSTLTLLLRLGAGSLFIATIAASFVRRAK